jgi:hypothetical protein
MRKAFLGIAMASAVALPVLAQTGGPVPGPHFVSVLEGNVLSSNLVGLDVVNAGDETIGEVKDVVLAGDKVQGFVVSVGGLLGIGEHYVVVDPSTLHVSYDVADHKWHASMDATIDQLKAAPAFTYEGKWKS